MMLILSSNTFREIEQICRQQGAERQAKHKRDKTLKYMKWCQTSLSCNYVSIRAESVCLSYPELSAWKRPQTATSRPEGDVIRARYGGPVGRKGHSRDAPHGGEVSSELPNELTNSVELSITREATSCAATR
jgi:hypothetical protein